MTETASIRTRQNDDHALKLLILVRRLYAKSKKWGKLRLLGVLALGLITPIITLVFPDAAVIIATAAIIWLSLSRTVFKTRERQYSLKAAAIQNEFDSYVFGIDAEINSEDELSLEDRADILPRDEDLGDVIKKERIANWYVFNHKASDTLNIAVAQRANAAYTDRLLRANSSTLAVASILWTIICVTIGLIIDISSSKLVFGVIIPLIPGLLDNLENWKDVKQASKQRGLLAEEIETTITNDFTELGTHISNWQTRIYELRKATPYLPEFLYKATRNKNEYAMKVASQKLLEIGNK